MSYRYILESDSPIRLTEYNVTPVTPPVVPPVVVVPPAPPVRGPFIWPTDIGPMRPMEYYERVNGRWDIPGRSDDDPEGKMLATAPSVGRPTYVLSNAGFITAGRYAGLRLWAPRSAPDYMLWAVIEGRL